MALRVDYLARETGQNLVRNPLLTLATVMTVWISLIMLIVTMLLAAGVDHAFAEWNDDVSFIVFVNADAPKDQVDNIRKELLASPQVDTIDYFDHQRSYDLFKKLFPNDPMITDTVHPSDLPTSFRVKPKNPNAQVVANLGQTFKSKPGVYNVDFPAESVKLVQHTAGKIINALLVGSIALLIAALMMIFVAIQTAVFARRREIEVMKLVGATNWFIRIPFVLEGLIECLVGALLAAGLAILFSHIWLGSLNNKATATLFDSISWTQGQLYIRVGIALALGATVGAAGSAASVTWYLRS